METHEMICETETSSEALFVCAEDACGRRVVVGKTRPRLVVIERGDFTSRHVGTTSNALSMDQVEAA